MEYKLWIAALVLGAVMLLALAAGTWIARKLRDDEMRISIGVDADGHVFEDDYETGVTVLYNPTPTPWTQSSNGLAFGLQRS